MKDLACKHVQWHVIGLSLSRSLCRAVLPLSQSTVPPRLVPWAALACGAPYPPLSFVCARLFLTLSFKCLYSILPCLKYAFPEMSPQLGLSCVAGGGAASWSHLCLAQSSSGLSSKRPPLQPSLLPILCFLYTIQSEFCDSSGSSSSIWMVQELNSCGARMWKNILLRSVMIQLLQFCRNPYKNIQVRRFSSFSDKLVTEIIKSRVRSFKAHLDRKYENVFPVWASVCSPGSEAKRRGLVQKLGEAEN